MSRRSAQPAEHIDHPPGPGWPVIAQTAALVRFRHRFVPWLRRKYGETIRLTLAPGRRTQVLLSRTDDIKSVFSGDPEVLHAGKGNAILGPVMGRRSVLLVDGAEHKRARKLLMPAFSARALRGYQPMIAALAKEEVSRWRPGEELRSHDRMNALTLEVILQVVFGVSDTARLAALRPVVTALVDVSPVVLLGWTLPWLGRVGMWKAARENRSEMDRLIYEEIAERRASTDLASRTDVLSALMLVEEDGDRLSDIELRDQLVTLLLAGHETTATALAWALREVGNDAAQRERGYVAARDGDDEWLEAALKESMRLHPVIPNVARELQEPLTVGDYTYERGVVLAPSIILTHEDPANYPRPEAFDPTRFIGQAPAPNTWIPFGGGARRCIGAAFSLMEGVAILREILTAYDVEAVGDEEPKVRNITSVPRNGSRIRLHAR